MIDGYPANLAVQGNDLVLNVTPEPTTLALLVRGAGLLGWGWRRRSKRRRRLSRLEKLGLSGAAKPIRPAAWAEIVRLDAAEFCQ